MLHEPVRDDPGCHLPAVANLLSAAVAQGEGERLGEVFGRGGFQVDGLGGYGDSALFHPRIRLGETARGRESGA
jgi:hypothetical protein